MHGSLYKRATDALAAIEYAGELASFLNRLSELRDLIDGRLKKLAEAPDTPNITNTANDIRGISTLLPNLTTRTNLRVLFREVEELTESLVRIFSDTHEPYVIADLNHQINEVADLYNTFVQTPTPEVSIKLLERGTSTKAALKAASGIFNYLIANGRDDAPHEGESEFSLDLSYTTDLDDFARRLAAISTLYSELSQLLGESGAPLRVAKIESGSLLTRLIGDTRVVELLVDLLRGGTNFFHRNYTNEGKIAAIAPKLEAVEKALGLSKKLQEAGVDVTSMNEQLGKGAHAIATNIGILLADQPVVAINNEVISIGKKYAQLMVERNRVQRLSLHPDLRIDPTWEDEPPDAPALGLPGPG